MAELTTGQIAVAIRAATDPAMVPASVEAVLEIMIPAARDICAAFAPDAPDSVGNAALVRLVGWLWDSDPADASLGRALQNSGAGPLLSQWRKQRAAVLAGESSGGIPTPTPTPGGNVPNPPGSGHFILTSNNGSLSWVEFPNQ